jgi:hypothetical protein
LGLSLQAAAAADRQYASLLLLPGALATWLLFKILDA